MGTVSLTVKYRPLRVGLLVAHGEFSPIVRAAAINSMLWGGIYNPIIPVGQDPDMSEQLIDLYRPDVLVPIDPATNQMTDVLDKHRSLQTPAHYARRIFYSDWDTKKLKSAVLDIAPIITHRWDTMVSGSPAGYRSNCVIVDWEDTDPANSLLALSFGTLPTDDQLLKDYKRLFTQMLRSESITVGLGTGIDPALATLLYPLALTKDRLHFSNASPQEDGLYLGSARDYDDLIAFWNLRAAGLQLQFLPSDLEPRFHGFIQAHLDALCSAPSRLSIGDGSIAIHTTPRSLDAAPAVLATFTVTKPLFYVPHDNLSWSRHNMAPSEVYLTRDNVLANVDAHADRFKVSLQLPPKIFIPPSSQRDAHNQQLALVLEPLGNWDYPDHTLIPPLLPELNELLSREIAFDPWKLRVAPGGVALIIQAWHHSETLFPISEYQLLVGILHSLGISAEMSTPGFLAREIIRSMRPERSLDGCRVFKIRGVRSLLKDPAIATGVRWEQVLEAIGKDAFSRFKDLYIESREEAELRPDLVARFLLSHRIIKPHLRTRSRLFLRQGEIRCVRCTLRSKARLSAYEAAWICPDCGYEQQLWARVATDFKSKAMWRFKSHGLFARQNRQEGALPVILTLFALHRQIGGAEFLYSTPHKIRTRRGKECEVDVLALLYSEFGGIEMAVGECKDEHGVIDENDVANLRDVIESFSESAIRCYPVFAKTSDGFEDGELELFKNLVRDGLVPILFTRTELEPYDPYEEHKGLGERIRYPARLEDMAMNSITIYLSGVES